jgi:FkbM family methyltransferase
MPPGVFAGNGAVVDVGAHYGEWTAAVLAFVGDRPLIAIEPTPKSAAGFRQRHGNDPRVTLHEVAVGNQIGQAQLTLSNRPVFNSLLPIRAEMSSKYAGVAEVGVVDVPCTTLDQLLAGVPEIALLKIDVQGTEADVLAGAAQTLTRTASILIEMNFVSHYEGDSLAWELHPLLTAAGFGLQTYIHQYADEEGRLLWADAVYRRL